MWQCWLYLVLKVLSGWRRCEAAVVTAVDVAVLAVPGVQGLSAAGPFALCVLRQAVLHNAAVASHCGAELLIEGSLLGRAARLNMLQDAWAGCRRKQRRDPCCWLLVLQPQFCCSKCVVFVLLMHFCTLCSSVATAVLLAGCSRRAGLTRGAFCRNLRACLLLLLLLVMLLCCCSV